MTWGGGGGGVPDFLTRRPTLQTSQIRAATINPHYALEGSGQF